MKHNVMWRDTNDLRLKHEIEMSYIREKATLNLRFDHENAVRQFAMTEEQAKKENLVYAAQMAYRAAKTDQQRKIVQEALVRQWTAMAQSQMINKAAPLALKGSQEAYASKYNLAGQEPMIATAKNTEDTKIILGRIEQYMKDQNIQLGMVNIP
jgi:hypothetical protein